VVTATAYKKNLKINSNASILHLHANLHVHAFEEKRIATQEYVYLKFYIEKVETIRFLIF
jgi:hypothetical protein